MRQSKLFTKVARNTPKGEVAVNAQLLERGGFIYKNSAGVYSYLPLGWRVLQRIAQIIREEIDALDAQELFMPAMVEKKYLDATGRWNVDVGYKLFDQEMVLQSRHGNMQGEPAFTLGWTHEEVLTAITAKYISSYKDLPFAAYQIQTKFRNEPRAKSGLLRGKEFIMKDLYSFHASEEDFERYYESVAEAYHKIFRRVGLEAIYTLAGGGDFTLKHTHEFQVPSEVGEDTIYVCSKCAYAENKEISKLTKGDKCPKCGSKIEEKKAIEVGNIFPLGTKYSEAFNLSFADPKGAKKPVIMGSYGIGLGRLMGTIVELYHDEAGIRWPEAVAPFAVHLLELNDAKAEDVYNSLQHKGIQVLYDDREGSAGGKLVEADLIGIPWRLVASPKLKGQLEIKHREASKPEIIKADVHEIIKKITA